MSQKICRWGILGAADIARKNWLAIRNAENCTLTAVASRDPERCRPLRGDGKASNGREERCGREAP